MRIKTPYISNIYIYTYKYTHMYMYSSTGGGGGGGCCLTLVFTLGPKFGEGADLCGVGGGYK